MTSTEKVVPIYETRIFMNQGGTSESIQYTNDIYYNDKEFLVVLALYFDIDSTQSYERLQTELSRKDILELMDAVNLLGGLS